MNLEEINRMWGLWWDWADVNGNYRFGGFCSNGSLMKLIDDEADQIMLELPYLLLDAECNCYEATLEGMTNKNTFSFRLKWYLNGLYPLEKVA